MDENLTEESEQQRVKRRLHCRQEANTRPLPRLIVHHLMRPAPGVALSTTTTLPYLLLYTFFLATRLDKFFRELHENGPDCRSQIKFFFVVYISMCEEKFVIPML